MRFLATTDWHLDAVTAGVPRLPELEAHIDSVEVAISEMSVDVVVFLGDAFDPGRMLAPHFERVLFGAAQRFAAAARLGAVFIAGNHDVIESAVVTTTLSGLAELQGSINGLIVAERPGLFTIGSVRVLALPYVSLAAQRAHPTMLEEALDVASIGKTPLVVLGHMTVPGAPIGSESREMSRGRELDLPDLASLKPALVLNGHYHRPCVVRYGGVDVVIPGSPLSLTFGEKSGALRGYVVADVQVGSRPLKVRS